MNIFLAHEYFQFAHYRRQSNKTNGEISPHTSQPKKKSDQKAEMVSNYFSYLGIVISQNVVCIYP